MLSESTMNGELAIDATHQRARFEAVRRRVFDEMRHIMARWRLALVVPFHVAVIIILATRDFPRGRLAIQITATVIVLAALMISERVAAVSMRKAKLFLMAGGLALFTAIANTGGLGSPLVLSIVPFVAGVAMNPELNRKRRKVLFVHFVMFVLLAFVSCNPLCALTGPLAPYSGIASTEYVLIAMGSITLTLFALVHMGQGVTLAYERITMELAERRDELCDENEGRTRALEGIAARLAHEVKNPLAAIKGLSTHVARNAEDPKVKERLTIVAQEAERLQEIVDGFLSFSRGLDELHVGPTKPYEIARELSLLLETRAADADVTLEVRGSRELTLNADGKKLRQALLNLVLNAMQASSKGSTVTLEIAKSCSDGAAVIRVQDRGAGMTPDVLDRIRKPYFTTKEGGSGLGIAVARGIIEQHGGALKFESTSGRGTTATVMLPPCAMKAQKERGRQELPNPCREKLAAMVGKTAPVGEPEKA